MVPAPAPTARLISIGFRESACAKVAVTAMRWAPPSSSTAPGETVKTALLAACARAGVWDRLGNKDAIRAHDITTASGRLPCLRLTPGLANPADPDFMSSIKLNNP